MARAQVTPRSEVQTRKRISGSRPPATANWHSFSRLLSSRDGWSAALDRWLHTTWLYLAGILLGIAAGFIELIRTVLRDTK